jgi:hypothetical protein
MPSWLPSSEEDEQQKAQRRRLQKDSRPDIHAVVNKLDAMRNAPSSPAPVVPAPPHHQQRIDPKTITERPEPKVISEGYQPRIQHEVEPFEPPSETTAEPVPSNSPEPDGRLIEIVRLWSKLNERDREELLLTAKMKVYLNSQRE